MKGAFINAFFFLACNIAYSQDTAISVLTFPEAVNIGLEKSTTLNQQKNQLWLNEVQKNSSLAMLGPTVNGSLDAFQVNGNSFNQQHGRAINGVRDAVQGTLSANWTIFNGLNRINTLRQSTNLLDAQEYNLRRVTQDVINTVASQYLQVLLDKELLYIEQQNFEVQKNQYNLVKEQVSLGSRSPVDEYNQEALMKNAEIRMLQAEITMVNDKALLAQTLQIDPLRQFDVAKPSWNIEELNQLQLKEEELIEVAKQFRGDYQRAIKTEKAQELGLHASKSAFMPSLVAFGNYGSAYNFQRNVPDSILAVNEGLNRPFKNQFRIDNVYKSYGLSLSVPIFTGLRNRTSYVQQKVVHMNSKITLYDAEIQLRNDVQRSVKNFELIKQTFAAAVIQMRAAEMAFQLETERYNLSITNMVDYTTANRAYIQAKTDRAQAEYRLIFQKILLDYATGTLKAEDIK